MSPESPARAFHGIPLPLQFCDQESPVVALNFNGALFHCASGSAFLLQFLGDRLEFFGGYGQAGDEGHAFSLASFCRKRNPCNSISWDDRLLLLTGAFRLRHGTRETCRAMFRRIDQGGVGIIFSCHHKHTLWDSILASFQRTLCCATHFFSNAFGLRKLVAFQSGIFKREFPVGFAVPRVLSCFAGPGREVFFFLH